MTGSRAFAVLHPPTATIARVVWRGGYGTPAATGQRTDHVELVRDGHHCAAAVYTDRPLSIARDGTVLASQVSLLDLTRSARQRPREIPRVAYQAMLHPDGDRVVEFRAQEEPVHGLVERRWDGTEATLWVPSFTRKGLISGARGIAVFGPAPDASHGLYEYFNSPHLAVSDDGRTWSLATQERQLVVRDGELVCNVCWGHAADYYLHYQTLDGDRVLRAGHPGVFALDLQGNLLVSWQTDHRRPIVSAPVRVGDRVFVAIRTEQWNTTSGLQHRAYEVWELVADSLKPVRCVGTVPPFYCEHDEATVLPMPDGRLAFAARMGDVRFLAR